MPDHALRFLPGQFRRTTTVENLVSEADEADIRLS
jgi:hypothetical protein